MPTGDSVFNIRAYAAADYDRLVAFAGEVARLQAMRNVLHPGDVRHNMSNGLRGADPSDYFFLAENLSGDLLAYVMCYPARMQGFSVVIHPQHRTPDLERALIHHGETVEIALMRAAISTAGESAKAEMLAKYTWVGSDITDGDDIRRAHLIEAGYTPGEPSLMLATRSLETPIPDPVLPDGYSIRSAVIEEADAVADVHSSAFLSNWQPGHYAVVMRSPAFEPQNERIVIAPNGDYAAFVVLWFDPVSRSGLFEPVGCHANYRRRGLTKALMLDGLQQMRSAGLQTAYVAYHVESEDPAGAALYRSAGFQPLYTIRDARKPITL